MDAGCPRSCCFYSSHYFLKIDSANYTGCDIAKYSPVHSNPNDFYTVKKSTTSTVCSHSKVLESISFCLPSHETWPYKLQCIDEPEWEAEASSWTPSSYLLASKPYLLWALLFLPLGFVSEQLVYFVLLWSNLHQHIILLKSSLSLGMLLMWLKIFIKKKSELGQSCANFC